MEKHTAYFNLLEQVQGDQACPVCATTRKSLQAFLDSYLYEGVNDDTNWNRLAAARGWCARHAGQLEGFSDGLAVSLYYRFEIRERLKGLGKKEDGGFFRRKVEPARCPGCLYQAEVEAGQAALIARAWEEAEFRKALEAHPGLCLPHVRAVLETLPPQGREAFLSQASAKLEALCAELDEFVRKSDYRNSDKMGPEGDAWKRALRRVYGPLHQG